MGCGNSKVDAAGEVVPAKIRPLLLRRYEELKKRTQGATLDRESTLSKKKLLKDAPDEDDNSNSSLETETLYKTVVSSPRRTEPSKVVPLPHSQYQTNEAEDRKANTEHNDKDKTQKIVETEEGKAAQNEHDDHDDDDFEIGRLVCPGSPSFRIYCNQDQNQNEEGKNQEMAMPPQKPARADNVKSAASVHQKSPSVDSVESATSDNSKNSNEGVEMESSPKSEVNKKKKFGAVRNLLNVKSYYSNCSCTGNDRSRLISAKATN